MNCLLPTINVLHCLWLTSCIFRWHLIPNNCIFCGASLYIILEVTVFHNITCSLVSEFQLLTKRHSIIKNEGSSNTRKEQTKKETLKAYLRKVILTDIRSSVVLVVFCELTVWDQWDQYQIEICTGIDRIDGKLLESNGL